MSAKFNVEGIKPKKTNQPNALKTADKIAKKQTKGKGGRPPKAAAERLTKKITCNFTSAEFDILDSLSKESGLPVAAFIRTKLKNAGVI